MIRGGIVGGLWGVRGGDGGGTTPNASQIPTNSARFTSFLSSEDDTVQKALEDLDKIETHIEYAPYIPDRFTYTETQRNTYGALYILYAQAAQLPTIDIDNNYFTDFADTWSLTKPEASDTLNTYYAIGYDEGTDGAIADMLGVRQPVELKDDEDVTIYYSPSNTPAPASGTKIPPAPWIAATPQATQAQQAYFTVLTSFEPDINWHHTERDPDTHFRVMIGKLSTEALRLPFTEERVIELIREALGNIVGEEDITIPAPSPFNYSGHARIDPDTGALEPLTRDLGTLLRYDLNPSQTRAILDGKAAKVIVHAGHGAGYRGRPPILTLTLDAGPLRTRVTVPNGAAYQTIALDIPGGTAGVNGIQVTGSVQYRGLGASGTITLTDISIHTVGTVETLLEPFVERIASRLVAAEAALRAAADNTEQRSRTDADNRLQQQIDTLLSAVTDTPAVSSFHDALTQRHEEGTTITPPSSSGGYAPRLAGSVLRTSRIVGNEITDSDILMSASSEADAEFKLRNIVNITAPNANLEKILIGGRMQFPQRLTIGHNIDDSLHVLSVGVRGSSAYRKVLALSQNGFVWLTLRTAGPTETITDEVLDLTDNYREYGYYDDDSRTTQTWTLPTGITTFKVDLEYTANAAPSRANQSFTLNAGTSRAAADQTFTFTEQDGSTVSVTINWAYNATNRKLTIISGANSLPFHANYNALHGVTIDRLFIRVFHDVSHSVRHPAAFGESPITPTSSAQNATRMGSGTEREFYFGVQSKRGTNGHAVMSIFSKANGTNEVIAYNDQDLGYSIDQLDFSRIKWGETQWDQWHTDILYNTLDPLTNTELAAIATAEAQLFGLVTPGSTTSFNRDLWNLQGNINIQGALTVNGRAVNFATS